jgi:glycerate dehydrogenase
MPYKSKTNFVGKVLLISLFSFSTVFAKGEIIVEKGGVYAKKFVVDNRTNVSSSAASFLESRIGNKIDLKNVVKGVGDGFLKHKYKILTTLGISSCSFSYLYFLYQLKSDSVYLADKDLWSKWNGSKKLSEFFTMDNNELIEELLLDIQVKYTDVENVGDFSLPFTSFFQAVEEEEKKLSRYAKHHKIINRLKLEKAFQLDENLITEIDNRLDRLSFLKTKLWQWLSAKKIQENTSGSKKEMKVVDIGGICSYPDLVEKLKKHVDEFIVLENPVYGDDEVLKSIADADIVISFLIDMSKKVIENSPNLKMISLGTTGFNYVDLDAAKQKGVSVCYAPAYATQAVAEHSIGLLLAAARLMFDAGQDLKEGEYDHSKYQGKVLYKKTLGVIGYGKIGQAVAKIAKDGFDMEILYTDEYSTPEDLDKLLVESDFISLHAPLLPQTKNLLSKREFELMKDGVVIVNTARGQLIDEEALMENLKSGKVFAVGLDVLAQEPLDINNPLIKFPRVFVTPHIAYNTEESKYESASTAVDNIIKFLEGKPENMVCV